MAEVKFTDLDLVDVNISFSKEYLNKAKFSKDKEKMLKMLLLANQSIKNAIVQLDNNIEIKNDFAPQDIKKNLN